MSLQWKYGTDCSECGGQLGKGKCKGMCKSCYGKFHKSQNMNYLKENRRVARVDWESSTFKGYTPTSHDWARLAAFIDGEGHIGLSPRKTNSGKTMTFCGRVIITNTSPRLASWCATTFGIIFSLSSAKSKNWKDCYHIQAVGYQAAWVLHNCLSWFVIKKDQADLVLEHQESTRTGTWNRGSGVTTPDNILQYRTSLKDRLQILTRRGSDEDIPKIQNRKG